MMRQTVHALGVPMFLVEPLLGPVLVTKGPVLDH